MARIADQVLKQRGFLEYTQAPAVNLTMGGQMGPMTDLRHYVNNSAYIPCNLIALLLEAPTGFRYLPEPELYYRTLKAMVEMLPTTIEGFNAQLDVEYSETVVGGGGQRQEDISKVTQQQPTPTFVWPDKYGKPISRMLRSWITDLIQNPYTGYAGVISRTRQLDDLLPDFSSMTCLFFEPDPTHTKVNEAWLCTNMKPKTSGPIEGRRDQNSGGQPVELSIEFTSLAQTGYGVMQLAQQHLDRMVLTGLNPNIQPAFISGATADVQAAGEYTGYNKSLTDFNSLKIA